MNLNRVMLAGRLTRDPEGVSTNGGGYVCKFGFAINSRRKNKSGEWEDEATFVDVEIWNRGDNNAASRAAENLRKGSAIFIDGRLKYEQWTSQDGTKRSVLKITADTIQYLDPKPKSDEQPQQPIPRTVERNRKASDGLYGNDNDNDNDNDIPF